MKSVGESAVFPQKAIGRVLKRLPGVFITQSVILFELQLLIEQLQFALSVYSCTSSGKHISFSLNTKESSARMRNFEIMLPNQNKNWTPEFSVISTFLLFHASRDNDLCKHWTQSPQTIISSGNVLFVIV